jgi:hypothetical protein
MRVEVLGQLAILGEINGEFPCNRNRLRHVPLSNLQIPQREPGLGVGEEIGVGFLPRPGCSPAPVFRLPPPSNHFVPSGILVSTM